MGWAGVGITTLSDTAGLAGLSMATCCAVRHGWPQLSQLPHGAAVTTARKSSVLICVSVSLGSQAAVMGFIT